MNLQQLMRAAVCAALVVVCLASAGRLLAQPVGGQQLDAAAGRNWSQNRPTYRPGLRNSFMGHPLDAKELELLLTHLRQKTGFVRMRFDEAGFLTIDDRSRIAGGSATARELLLATVDGKKSIDLQSHNRSSNVAFGRVSNGPRYEDWRSKERIAVEQIAIDFADFKHLRGHAEAVEAFDLGFVILHELCHAVLELHDPSAGVSAAGDCETYVNRVRRELGVPERQRYGATAYLRKMFAFSPTSKVAELIFARTEPGRQPGRGAKTKRLRLMWNVQEVGDIRPLPTSPRS